MGANEVSEYNQLEDYTFFKKKLPDLMIDHAGDFVVIHNREITDFFGDKSRAIRYAERTFGSGCFIVQEIHRRRARPASHSLLV